ncbi:hypothetical protein N9O24_00415 [bacterium]|nr:hypothetical protein [bacterium]
MESLFSLFLHLTLGVSPAPDIELHPGKHSKIPGLVLRRVLGMYMTHP